MSLNNWNLFWWLAVMLILAVTSDDSTNCNKHMIITDLNSVAKNNTSGSQSGSTYQKFQKSNDTLIGNLCHMNVMKGTPQTGHCKVNNYVYNFIVTYKIEQYDVILNDTVGIQLWFIHNATSMVPSCINDAGHLVNMSLTFCEGLKVANVTVQNLCNNRTDYNKTACTGTGKYVLHVPMKGQIYCYSCTDPLPAPEMNITDNNIHVNPETAPDIMDKLPFLVQQMGNKSSAELNFGHSEGLIYIQRGENKDVSIGYDSGLGVRNVLNQKLLETNFSWYVKIPQEAFTKAQSQNNSTPFVGILRVPNFNKDNGGNILNDEVFGISMGANITDLTQTIDIHFKAKNTNGMNISCNSWDGKDTTSKWTTFGCKTNNTSGAIICSCTHLTFFALLMSQPDTNATAQYVESLTYITYIGCGLSTFFLLVGLFIYFVTWHPRANQANTILMNLFLALCLLNITFLSNQQVASSNSNTGCIIIAAVMHCAMLATFTWYFIQGLYLYLRLIQINTEARKFKLGITVLGWGLPALVVIIIAASGNYQLVTYVQFCWITNPYIHYIVNVGYYALIFIFTMIIFVVIVRVLLQARISKVGNVKTSSKKFGAILSLFVVLGFTWGVAFFSYGAMAIPSYFIFSILNSFQGFFLFIYYYKTRTSGEAVQNEQPISSSVPSIIKERSSSATEISEYDNYIGNIRVE